MQHKNKLIVLITFILISILVSGFTLDFNFLNKYEVISEPVSNMNVPRSGHSSFLMDDGRVFISGGYIQNKNVPTCEDKKLTAEIFDPKTKNFTLVENLPVEYGAEITNLKNGKLFILTCCGCQDGEYTVKKALTALIYDPITGHSEKIQEIKVSDIDIIDQTILLDNGNVLILARGNVFRSLLYSNETKKITPLNASFKDNISFGSRGGNAGEHKIGVKLKNGNILLVCGLYDQYVHNKKATNLEASYNSIIYDYKQNMFIPIKGVNKIDVHGLSIHTPVLLKNGDVLVCEDGFLAHWPVCEVFDHNTEKFRVVGSMHEIRKDYSMILLQDGSVLISGGKRFNGYAFNLFLRPSTLYDSVEIFNPETEKFTIIKNVIEPKSGFSSVLLKDNSVLITGGLGQEFYGGSPWKGWENFRSDNAQKADILKINNKGGK